MMRPVLRLLYRAVAAVLTGSDIERFAVVRWLHSRVRGLIRRDVATVHGYTLHLDKWDTLNLSLLPDFEPEETALVQRELQPGNTVIDIGANIGYFTLLFAGLVGETGKVYAFEPEPGNFEILQRNIRENGFKNVQAEPKAVANAPGVSRLYLSPIGGADHRLYETGADGRASIDVQTVTLDDYFAGSDTPIDFIKVDVQGLEDRILAGMSKLLARSPSVKLLTEFWPVGLQRSGVEPSAFLEHLHEAGFELLEYNDRSGSWEPVDTPALLARNTVENERFVSLLCVKRG